MSKMTKCKTCGEEIATSAKTCPKCGAKNKKPFYKKWWFWTIVVLIILGAVGTEDTTPTASVETGSTETQGSTEQQEQQQTEAPEVTEEAFKESCQELDCKSIARNPNNFKDTPIRIYGKVIQVSEDTFGGVTLRVATSEDDYTDDIYLVTYKQTESNRVLENDMIIIWGICKGVTTYKTVLGDNVTVPSVELKYYDIGEQ